MATIRQADPEQDRALIEDLFLEYLDWAVPLVNREYGTGFDVPSMIARDMAKLEIFLPPQGRLLLAFEGERAAGLACMRSVGAGFAEVKRMYVRPAFRGRGIGRTLLDALLAKAGEMGCHVVRLDSPRFFTAAHALYRAAGFYEIAPYPESEIPPAFRRHWLFMERKL